VVLLTISSPDRLNAFSAAMRRQLIEALSELDAAEDTRAIILMGAGDRAFSAGQDLTEAQSLSGDDAQSWVEEWAAVYRAILNLDTPTLAALNGYAVGAGFQVALMCDLRLASTTARVGMPEVDDAIPCVTGSWSLANLLGRAQITDLVLTGRLLSADDMLGWGIVSELVTPAHLLESAQNLAGVMARKDRLAVRLDKAWLRRDLLDRLPDAVKAAKLAHAKAFESGEPRRVMGAFLARSPTARRT
jgi:enoyl-CoA hydratase/carnithine racemase